MRRPAEPRLTETVALGLLQGPAELLPISSSAHVELLPWLLGWRHARLPGERRKEVAVALHAGTAVALGVASLRETAASREGVRGAARRRTAAPMRVGSLAAATGPAAVVGFLLERPIERRLGGPRAVAAGLLAGSVALVASDRVAERRDAASLVDALWLGAAQAAALAPGVSRSGAVRSAARARGFTRAAAAELSAELALPVLAGATALKGLRLARRRPGRREAAALAAGAAAAALSTAAALRLERAATVPPAVWAAYRTALALAVLAADRRLRENGPR